ncbi:hypothetical protein M436DRAFT_75980 [Aureobasidium namibiae CBS 147.97]|uniref:Aminoglycoside phosphotransferase domain-containing protein n=1 Tax=Aureobasidium namibiae CBS 147.97 TaxID=1043004 RepID=A0A074X497_9PEZI
MTMDQPVVRFSTCSILDCGAPGVRGMSCSTCQQHLCVRHSRATFHKCSAIAELSDQEWVSRVENEMSQTVNRINVPELEKRASALKGNIACSFKQSSLQDRMMGNAIYHAWLTFDDGDRWLLRTPITKLCDIPDNMTEYFIASEYATLKFLEPTNVPAPKVFGYGLASDKDNVIGVSYLLMCILAQIAEIFVEISKHPVSLAGSLTTNDGHSHVAMMASNRFIHLDLLGPFSCASDYFTAVSERYLDLIADGQVHAEYPVEAFAFYSLARAKIHTFTHPNTVQNFFLKHVDDKGDHLLVDEDGKISRIRDWQFARFVPAIEAFGPSYLTANMDRLHSRDAGVTDLDKKLAKELRQQGANDLAGYMDSNEIARRFHNGLSDGISRIEAREMLDAWRKTFGSILPSDLDAWISQTCDKDARWEKVSQLGDDVDSVKSYDRGGLRLLA